MISYFQPEFNRAKLLSESELSSDEEIISVEIAKVHKKTFNEQQELINWNKDKIRKLMELGVGDINSKYITSIKTHHLKIQRNQSFLRMYLFLNPFTMIIFSNWNHVVKPK